MMTIALKWRIGVGNFSAAMEEHLRPQAPHVVVFPLMGQGHMNPMIDLGRILASHGCRITMLTTPGNASRFDSLLQWSSSSGLRISVVTLPFPSKLAGLPENCESLASVTTNEMMTTFMAAYKVLQQPFEEFVVNDPPSCIISDQFFPWTVRASQRLKIPRYSFVVTSCFGCCVMCSIMMMDKPLLDDEEFAVPGLPDEVKITAAVMQANCFKDGMDYTTKAFVDELILAEQAGEGVIANSSSEIEPGYVEHYKAITRKHVFTIGPISLSHREEMPRAENEIRAAQIEEGHSLQEWLDSKAPRSVVYVCFGSISTVPEEQLMEIGLGLESSNHPFIWVTRGRLNESFLRDLQKRVEGRGLLIADWAPQRFILSHHAVGAFMTHCGWSSVMEGIGAGLPLITWPMFGEQHINEKLLVHVLAASIPVGNKHVMGLAGHADNEQLVGHQQVEKAIARVLGDGEESREMREKAREIGELVRRSVEVGSSALNLKAILQKIGCPV